MYNARLLAQFATLVQSEEYRFLLLVQNLPFERQTLAFDVITLGPVPVADDTPFRSDWRETVCRDKES